MAQQAAAKVSNNRQTRFLLLLVSLLAMMVLEPFLFDYTRIWFLVDIFFSIILFTSIYAVSDKKSTALIAILLAVPKLATLWIEGFISYTPVAFLDSIFGIAFIGYIIILILRHIFKQKEVTLETIYGAIVVYILIGLLWVFFYKLTEILHPGSFSMAADIAASKKTMYYFSFITLTTLGYGDITPVSDQAKSLAMLEAVVGQMFIAVLIARLVGIHITQSLIKK
jgi:hypothetical protein